MWVRILYGHLWILWIFGILYLLSFGTFCVHLGTFFPVFGNTYQEKSGNPAGHPVITDLVVPTLALTGLSGHRISATRSTKTFAFRISQIHNTTSCSVIPMHTVACQAEQGDQGPML
jgi:hypothetical protein